MKLHIGDIIYWYGGTYEITDEVDYNGNNDLVYNLVQEITPSEGNTLHSTNLNYNHTATSNFYLISSNPKIEPRRFFSRRFQMI